MGCWTKQTREVSMAAAQIADLPLSTEVDADVIGLLALDEGLAVAAGYGPRDLSYFPQFDSGMSAFFQVKRSRAGSTYPSDLY